MNKRTLEIALSNIPEMVDYRMEACQELKIPNYFDEFGVPNVDPAEDRRQVTWDGLPPAYSTRSICEGHAGRPSNLTCFEPISIYRFVCEIHGPFTVRFEPGVKIEDVSCPASGCK